MPRVSLSDTTKVFEVNEGEILYDALYDRGEELPHGCLSGSCGACRVEVIKGAENLQEPGFIEQNTLEAIIQEYTEKFGPEKTKGKALRLSCRAKVKGDVEIQKFT